MYARNKIFKKKNSNDVNCDCRKMMMMDLNEEDCKNEKIEEDEEGRL